MHNKITFYSAVEDRPIFLSDTTRKLANRALSGEFGKSMNDPELSIDNVENIENISDYERYSCSIEQIAKYSPLRYDPDEMLLGSATLKPAKSHFIPAYYKGELVFRSTSHLTCGFDRIIKIGFKGLREKVLGRFEDASLNEDETVFLSATLSCLDSFAIWHQRYLELILNQIENVSEDRKTFYESVYNNARNVPENPPESFREAVQSLWFMFCFLRLCGNWPGIGRIDAILGPYLKNDLESGKITLEEAREILAQFWIKGCEWIDFDVIGSGDAQYYQNIVLGGIDESGNDITNEVTYLVLDIVEELGISEFPIAVRISRNTSSGLLRRIAEIQRHGGGIVGVYNEDLIINSMVDFGYDLSEARGFANDGCWEVQVPGKTCFAYFALDLLSILQNEVLYINDTVNDNETISKALDYSSFDELYAAFREKLYNQMSEVQNYFDIWGSKGYNPPALLISLFTEGCIEKCRDYHDKGAKYTVFSPHAGGLPDVANSLLAIRRLVYEEKLVNLPQLISVLKNNWEGHEYLRRYSSQKIDYFGNDNKEADMIAKKVYDDFISIAYETRERNGILRPPGISTFGRQIAWRWERGATADGHFKGEILSGNLSPTPGTDKKGATAIIKSHCSLELSRLTCGTALDLKLFPNTVKGKKGVEVLTSLIKGFISLGGFFMQTDILDNSILIEAQKDPLKYQNLAVRVSGWSARFVTLDREWQKMIMDRNSQGE